ncbi:MAG TPA: DUF2721 domain-containing protein [Draconibacterium sp.]|nr:DUF2721 domain-containing protein [Draconibacterium sp.]
MYEAFTLTTPALLFSAISLILLAFTNRFVAYTQVVRNLHKQYAENPTTVLKGQIYNLRKRLYLIRTMQLMGVLSLFLCVITMFLIFIGSILFAEWIFGAALLLLCASLAISMWEIQISVKALELHLSNMEDE